MAGSNRKNDFAAQTKRRLADRAGHECSICRAHTTGPSADDARAVNNVGVAAHIRGARPQSCRHEPSMSSAERSSIENAIWLCQTCAKKVDGDATAWPTPTLVQFKRSAERRAKERLGKRRRRQRGVELTLDSCFYIEHLQAAFVYVRIVNNDARAVTLELASLVIDGIEYAASEPLNSVRVRERNLLQRQPLRLSARDAVEGAWAFRGKVDIAYPRGEATMYLITKVVGRAAKKHIVPRNAARSSATTAPIPDDGSIR
jgi:hypothetical protein